MTPGAPVEQYDVVVLGSGAAGLTAALRAAAEGARVGLFERAEQSVAPQPGRAVSPGCRATGTSARSA
jgi:flavin-dependent dehydrogenase